MQPSATLEHRYERRPALLLMPPVASPSAAGQRRLQSAFHKRLQLQRLLSLPVLTIVTILGQDVSRNDDDAACSIDTQHCAL
jgi:hypothetical protein